MEGNHKQERPSANCERPFVLVTVSGYLQGHPAQEPEVGHVPSSFVQAGVSCPAKANDESTKAVNIMATNIFFIISPKV